MTTRALLAAALWMVVACAPGRSEAQPRERAPAGGRRPTAPVLVELFTSQGCSSCPPAEALLGQLGSRPGVLALAFHVDYWNRLGWADPFSTAAWSERQQRYAAAFGLDGVYTPQLVIAGRTHVVGSAAREIDAAIAAATRPVTIDLDATWQERVTPHGRYAVVRVTATRQRWAPKTSAKIMVAIYEVGLVTRIERGENAGRTNVDPYVVRALAQAGTLEAGAPEAGAEVSIPLAADWRQLGVVAFLQEDGMAVVGSNVVRLAAATP